jgi:protein-tyrosine phosphatase
MASFIEQESVTGVVYVHCKIGYSRTAAVACAYLVRTGLAASMSEAIEFVRRTRPSVVMRPEVLAALHEFEANEFSSPPTTRSLNNQTCL